MNKHEQTMMIELPEMAQQVLPEPEVVNFYKLYDKRTVYYMGEIDESLLEISKIIHLANIEDTGKPVEDRVPIKIFLFSEGGADQPTWNFVDMIAMSKTPVWTINCGLAMSNALTILVAGHKRFAFKHSSAMFHMGGVNLNGQANKEEYNSMNKWIAAQDKMYEAWFYNKVKVDQKLFNRKKKMDWYLNAEEMLEYSMIDKIIEDIDEVI